VQHIDGLQVPLDALVRTARSTRRASGDFSDDCGVCIITVGGGPRLGAMTWCRRVWWWLPKQLKPPSQWERTPGAR